MGMKVLNHPGISLRHLCVIQTSKGVKLYGSSLFWGVAMISMMVSCDLCGAPC